MFWKQCICTGKLNLYLSHLSLSISAAKVGIWSYFSVSFLGRGASFPTCLSLAQAVPRSRCSSRRTTQIGSCFHLTCFCYFTLFFNLPVFWPCLCRWGSYLFVLTLGLIFLLNLRVEAATVCRKVAVASGFVCASRHCRSILQKSSHAELLAQTGWETLLVLTFVTAGLHSSGERLWFTTLY